MLQSSAQSNSVARKLSNNKQENGDPQRNNIVSIIISNSIAALAILHLRQRTLKTLLLAGWPAELATSEDVQVKMKHRLTAVSAIIDHYTIATLVHSEYRRNFACHDQQMSK